MERRVAQLETLDQSVERLRSVVDHVVDGIVSIDERGYIATFNPAAERIFGWSAGEAIGRDIGMLLAEPLPGVVGGTAAAVAGTDGGHWREAVGRRRDGNEFPMELSVSEFLLGRRRHFTCIVRDITERKRAEHELRQAEERMRSVVDHVVDGIITIDASGLIRSFNPAAEKLFGFSRTEAVGRNVNMLMPEPYHTQHDRYLENYLGTGHAQIIGIGREVVGQRKDGSTFPMELAVSEFSMDGERFFTGIVRDITERKRLEQELRERLGELAAADRQKNEFLAMLAHELRNPLAPMRNSLHLLRMRGANEEIGQHARDVLERQMQHLVRLVDDLLDVSRIVRGKIELRLEVLDVAVAVARASETAQPAIESRGHELSVTLPEPPVWVEADLVRLAQIISNLLTNAAKYTDRGGRIALTVTREADQAVIRVRDTGIGIAADMLPRVFDLFVQGDQVLARSQGGLGIGLTLVKRLVAMHGGSVDVFSGGIGRGSEFVVRLPTVAHGATPGGDPGGSPSTAPSKRRILVVDDNVDAAESIAMILQLDGYDVRCVYDGLAVLSVARSYRPDVVVLDIGLPGISGYEVARLLRQQPEFERTLILAVTGYGQEADRRRSEEAGIDHHLTKPVDPEVLQKLLQRSEPPVQRGAT
jgi:PAS domain S-box-containing protein